MTYNYPVGLVSGKEAIVAQSSAGGPINIDHCSANTTHESSSGIQSNRPNLTPSNTKPKTVTVF